MSETLTIQQLRHPEVLRDLEAYWTVYERIRDDARAAAADELRGDPALEQVAEAALDDVQLQDRLRSLLAAAAREGDWEPYLAMLRQTGANFARSGLAFADWFHVVNAFRRHTVPHLLKAYGDDHDQLAAAVRGKGVLFDLALQTIGEAYLDVREATIAKQQAAIAELSTPVLQIRPGLLLMPIVGVVAMLAALGYSGGRRPYASRGLGEASVFVFFGLVATVGSQYVQDEAVRILAVAAAVPVGLVAVAVLVANNLRDIPTDAAAGRRTLAVRLGDARTRSLFGWCIGLAFLSVVVGVAVEIARPGAGLRVMSSVALVSFVAAAEPLRRIRTAQGRDLIAVLVGAARLQVVFGVLLALGLWYGT